MDAETDNDLSVDAAMTLVLDAERDALAEIEQCEQQADAIIRKAHQDIRGMVRRTEERIARLHSGCAERNRQRVAELEAAALADDAEPRPEHDAGERLAIAVAAAARRLTTLEQDGVD